MRIFLLIITLIFVLFSFSVFPRDMNEKQLQKVVLQLRWKHQFQFAGYYAAIKNGYYKKLGLQVILKEGGKGIDHLEEVENGHAQYGSSNTDVLIGRLDGKPLVALAAIFQHSPAVILARKGSNISSLQDFIGKKFLLTRRKDAEILASFMNEDAYDGIKFVYRKYSINHYLDKTIDGYVAFESNQPFTLKKMGAEFSILRPRTYGIDFYGDCLFTSESELKNHPERVRDFREASIRGWKYAFKHIDEIIDYIISEYSVSKSKEHLRYEANVLKKLTMPDMIEIGHMNPGRFKHIADTYARFGIVPKKYSLDGFIYSPHTKIDLAGLYTILSIISGICFIFGGISYILKRYNNKLKREIVRRKEIQKALGRSEVKYRELIESVPQGIAEISSNDTMLFMNSTFCTMMECKQDQCIGRTINSLAEEDHCFSILEKFGKDNQERPNSLIPSYQTICTLSGKKIELEIVCADKHDSTGRLNGKILILTDVTNTKKIEREREVLQQQMLNAAKLATLGEMVGNIAHEINNPLTVVLGNSNLMKKMVDKNEIDCERMKFYIKRIQKTVGRINDIIRGLRVISKNSEEMPFKKVKLKSLIMDTVSLCVDRYTYEEVGLFVCDIDDEFELVCRKTEISQVLLNLLSNAFDAVCELGEKWVRINVDVVDAERVEISVTDSGVGVPVEIRNDIFKPYFTTKGTRNGTGLGLSISHGLINRHHGTLRIDVDSSNTCFVMTLPRQPKSSKQTDANEMIDTV